MAEEDERVGCDRTDCQVAETGSCADGHAPLESCPHFGAFGEDDLDVYENDDGTDVEALEKADRARVVLPAGEALDADEVDQFLRWRPATFVTIVGDRESGKSTLLCALYDRLLRGPYANLGFAGSRTLVALERMSHYSRVDSGLLVPDTPRTSHLEGLRYFHFALTSVDENLGRMDLLLSDRAGEVYRQARGNSDIVQSLPEIPQSDRLVLLLDGRRAGDVLERANAMQAVRQTLRAFLDNDALDGTSVVQVVTTKGDLVAAHADAAEIDKAIQEFQSRLERDFRSRLRELTFWTIAARDPTGVFPPGHGLDELLTDWINPRQGKTLVPMPTLSLESEFDRLLARTALGGHGA